jgi:hypothetical protein
MALGGLYSRLYSLQFTRESAQREDATVAATTA